MERKRAFWCGKVLLPNFTTFTATLELHNIVTVSFNPLICNSTYFIIVN